MGSPAPLPPRGSIERGVPAPSSKAPTPPTNNAAVMTTSKLDGRPTDADVLELRRYESERPLYRESFKALQS